MTDTPDVEETANGAPPFGPYYEYNGRGYAVLPGVLHGVLTLTLTDTPRVVSHALRWRWQPPADDEVENPVLVGALDHREYVTSPNGKKIGEATQRSRGPVDGQWGPTADRARRHSAMAEQRAATQYGVIQTRTRPSGPVLSQSER